MAALPAPSVVTLAEPRKVRPSPLPAASHAGLEKNSMSKVVLAVELSVPLMAVVPPPLDAEARTGKFWRLLAPVSASPASLGVTPVPASPAPPTRLMPSRWLEKKELARMALPVPVAKKLTRTPLSVLKAMVLAAPGAVPPTALLSRELMKTPSPLLPRLRVPVMSVPMKLPWTVLALPLSRMPSSPLPEMTLRAPAAVPPTSVRVAEQAQADAAVAEVGGARRRWCR